MHGFKNVFLKKEYKNKLVIVNSDREVKNPSWLSAIGENIVKTTFCRQHFSNSEGLHRTHSLVWEDGYSMQQHTSVCCIAAPTKQSLIGIIDFD
jgi:hypothetical protein